MKASPEQPALRRSTFRTSRLLDFASEKELVAQTGHQRGVDPDEGQVDVDALLIGIRFLHDFAKTHQGEQAVKQALDDGFVELVQPAGCGDDD